MLGSTALAVLIAGCQPSEPSADFAAEPQVASRPPANTERPVPLEPRAGAEPQAEIQPQGDSLAPLTPEGWGPLRIGMSRDEVVAALGEDANPGAVGGPEPEVCDEFRPVDAPTGMIVMIERDTLSRITLVEGSDVRTEAGLGVGDLSSRVKETLGDRAEVSPHKYLAAPAEYVTVWTQSPTSPAPRGVVYETGANGRVSHVHAGSASIAYVEGCL